MAQRERIIGVSCLLMGGSGLILEVQKSHKWRRANDGNLVIGLGCIGGSLEEGETPVAALQREAQEEIGCELHLRSASLTIEVSPKRNVWLRDWPASDLRPAFVWENEGPGYIPDAKVAVYLGTPERHVQPRDLPAVTIMDIELMLRLGSGRLSLDDAISSGANVQQGEPIPRNALLELVGTPKVFYDMHSNYKEIAESIIIELQAMLKD
jgi:hypothetical protein